MGKTSGLRLAGRYGQPRRLGRRHARRERTAAESNGTGPIAGTIDLKKNSKNIIYYQ
jgi:hypothetical protein